MHGFVITLITCSVIMSVIALIYMAVNPLLAERYSEKWRYYVWLIILIGLIIPFRPQWDNALIKIDVPAETISPVLYTANLYRSNAVPVPLPTNAERNYSANNSLAWWQIAFAVWLAGLITFLLFHLIIHYKTVRLVKRWSENISNEVIISLFNSLKTEMGIKRHIHIAQCEGIGSPMMMGFFKPQILLPPTRLAYDELNFILKHELIHYKRGDLFYKLLVLIATAIHWFNPVVYIAAKAINTQCEMSCDAEIIQNADDNTRRRYIETIMGVVRHRSKFKTALSTNFYGGVKGMKNRIFSIMTTNKKKLTIGGVILSCTLVTILSMGILTAFASPSIVQGERNERERPIFSNMREERLSYIIVGEYPGFEFPFDTVSRNDINARLDYLFSSENLSERERLFVENYRYNLENFRDEQVIYFVDGRTNIAYTRPNVMRDLSGYPLEHWVIVRVFDDEYVYLLLDDEKPASLTPLSPVRIALMDWFEDFRENIPVVQIEDIVSPTAYPSSYAMIQNGADTDEIMMNLFNNEQFDITAVLAPNGIVDVSRFVN